MNKIQVLDCTLRDGGYCNQWRFGWENQKKMIQGLLEADIDIVECGFLTDQEPYERDVTKFNRLEQAADILPEERGKKLFVVMMNYGQYAVEKLPEYDGRSVDGIRVAFHKKDLEKALGECRKIKAKGYKVFVQAMVSLCYTDQEFLDLIRRVNEIAPYSFYIVDSFGMMKSKDLTRLFYMVEHNLDEGIWIGFHSHNNLQLAYSNAWTLTNVQTHRNLIIDTSVYGMGRGAGNLNTELFIDYLNESIGAHYKLKPVLAIIDDILDHFYQRNNWGYSLPNYISAIHNAHPNYAGYLDGKKTLTVENMNDIFDMMDEDKKVSYDREYIEELYLRYMTAGKTHKEHLAEMKKILWEKTVVLIAPGKSSLEEREKIVRALSEEGTFGISVNFDYPYAETDYIFLSNLRRYRVLDKTKGKKCIVTSNIPFHDAYLQVEYEALLTSEEAVRDNGGLMAIRFLTGCGAGRIRLAGFDGYSYNVQADYLGSQYEIVRDFKTSEEMNRAMSNVLSQLAGEMDIDFLTTPRHISID